jgi:hypothetical protein
VVLLQWESEEIRAERMPRDEGQEFAQGAEAEEGNGRSPARTEGIPSEQAKPALEGSPGLIAFASATCSKPLRKLTPEKTNRDRRTGRRPPTASPAQQST